MRCRSQGEPSIPQGVSAPNPRCCNLEQATRLDIDAGVTARINANLSLYAQASWRLALGGTDGGKRDGVKGDLGLRYTWWHRCLHSMVSLRAMA